MVARGWAPEDVLFETHAQQVSACKSWGTETDGRNFTPSRGLRVCASCGSVQEESKQFKRCGGCRLVYFCGSDCQKVAWKTHKKVCGKPPEVD
mmetsp:Transcript_5336/g.13536  ORF Transcript_5336/g.13536 Transcript_5336/m.13536 type:complete len:93 (+) Transcript_5336:1089-1367(+)